MFNWFIADTGFSYRSIWHGDEYLIFPTFSGKGYEIRTSSGERIGKAAEKLFSSKMEVTTPSYKVRFEPNGSTEYRLVARNSIIGNVKTSGVLRSLPISISLEPTKQRAAYLLIFFAILKDRL